jgi:hypothetical protein
MTEFQMEMLKILVDKVLLGAVAMAFGYYLSKRLEMLRTQKAYDLFVWQQRFEAAKTASRVVTEHFQSVTRMHAAIHEHADNPDGKARDHFAATITAFNDDLTRFRTELHSLTPLLSPSTLTALSRYLEETGPVARLLADDMPTGWPSKEDLRAAFQAFLSSLSSIVEAGPHRETEIKKAPDAANKASEPIVASAPKVQR